VRCAAVAQLVVHGAEEGGCHPPPPRWRTGLRKLVLHPARIFDGGACFEPPCSARRPVAGACSRVRGACSDERGEVTEEEVNSVSCM